MSDLMAARTQMALSFVFHIIFAEVGIALPVLMVLAEWRWQRTGDPVYLQLARRWAKGAAVLFAVGAVSGTVLSFELGLLWPRFMRFAGPIVGIPFSLEGFAFFTEAIFLGVYLYGWERISARAHLLAGVIVAVSGAASTVFVVSVNAWMNTPTGYTMQQGRLIAVDPIAGMLNPSTAQQALHMLLASYTSTAMIVAGIHAFVILRGAGSTFHRRALTLALSMAIPAAILQPISGDYSARTVATWQPIKLASLEGQFETQRGAPLRIGGFPDVSREQTRYAIELPRMLSLLAYHDPNAEVRGLREFPRENWPPIVPVHVAFQVMVGLGTIMALVMVWAAITMIRRRDIVTNRALLSAIAIVGPFGFIATEAGWTVTEIGRQPWVVANLIRTSAAVTPMPGLIFPMTLFALLYLGLSAIVIAFMATVVRETT